MRCLAGEFDIALFGGIRGVTMLCRRCLGTECLLLLNVLFN